jgi:ABC-type transport system involved in cytochrome bd biosynthesis fused ATPase/permease subunit
LQFKQHLSAVRGPLLLTVVLSLLGTLALIAQMTLLSLVVSDVFLVRAERNQLWPRLLLLLAVSVVRAALAGGREVAAQRAAVRVKCSFVNADVKIARFADRKLPFGW